MQKKPSLYVNALRVQTLYIEPRLYVNGLVVAMG